MMANLNIPLYLEELFIYPYPRYRKQILQGRKEKNKQTNKKTKGNCGLDSDFVF
jgi:hypothetical protein